MKKYNFPVISQIRINHFSLYKKNDFIEIELDKNVFCLAGANGLGKSTFITILNFALTGIVKKPNADFGSFKSMSGFYTKSMGFAKEFFEGRIDEENVDIAEVSVDFALGDANYSITRGFFEPEELRGFTREVDGKTVDYSENAKDRPLNEVFQTEFTKDVGLTEFHQFVFLQHYVFTFDETHDLLFWNEKTMERVLHLFFGVDSSKALIADQLRKEFNKYDSNARNFQYQITRTRTELNTLQKSLQSISDADNVDPELHETYKSKLEESEEVNTRLTEISLTIKDIELSLSDYSVKSSALRSNYSTIFNKTLSDQTPIQNYPEVTSALNDLKVRIFAGQDYNDIIERLVEYIKSLKENADKESVNTDYFNELEKIDSELKKYSDQIKSLNHKKERFIEEESAETERLKKLREEIEKIESDNKQFLRGLNLSQEDSGIEQLIKTYQIQIEKLSENKDDAYKKRNEASDALTPLEQELSQGYIAAEAEFIPLFNQFAYNFLGLTIQIELAINTKGARLALNISDTKRDKAYQLSESQRYFVDIALRMALIRLCTNSATILIDTPEGSLDIAYESRAGQMFADFVSKEKRMIMTANINSSRLLIELAERCKGEAMKIERMTNWTLLSDVQELEHLKIEEAYNIIEQKLHQ